MVTVFGLGFVGLTTALGFAHLGHKVYGIDLDINRKETLKSGNLPFLEPYMQEQLQKHLNNNFIITDNVNQAIQNSEYVFYCVGTPYGEGGNADLKYLFSAIDSTIDAINDNKFRVLVTKSTIPPSTTRDKICPYVLSKCDISKQLGIANNPEFLREGHCWEDFIHADRIVLGCNDEKSKQMLINLYSKMEVPVFCVSHTTGEFIKYLSNTLLATMISYSNEMAHIADVIGDIEVAKAFNILHMDKRWNNCNMTSYVYPGCGYGGYCLPKDTSALYAQACQKGFEPQILKNVIQTNTARPAIMVNKIIADITPDKTIGILGLSFKPQSDDVRDTAAYKIIEQLQKQGYNKIIAYDPVAIDEFIRCYPKLGISFAQSAREVYEQSDVIAIVTAWSEFSEVLKWGDKKIIDCRYMLK